MNYCYGLLLGLLLPISVFAAENTPVEEKASEPKPSIVFYFGDQLAGKYTHGQLKDFLQLEEVQVFDPNYQKEKKYRGVSLLKLLDWAYGPRWRENKEFSEAVFYAEDGSQAYAPTIKLRERGGFLAVSDLDFPEWEPIGRKKIYPGPFYVVWKRPEQSIANGFPWAWNVSKIEISRFEDQFPEVVPKNAKEGSKEQEGFEIFRSQCFRCHAIDRQGGKIGPDLHAPRNITTYRSEKMIKSFIREPSKFRYTTMPDHPHLLEDDLNALIAYFKNLKKQEDGKQKD